MTAPAKTVATVRPIDVACLYPYAVGAALLALYDAELAERAEKRNAARQKLKEAAAFLRVETNRNSRLSDSAVLADIDALPHEIAPRATVATGAASCEWWQRLLRVDAGQPLRYCGTISMTAATEVIDLIDQILKGEQ